MLGAGARGWVLGAEQGFRIQKPGVKVNNLRGQESEMQNSGASPPARASAATEDQVFIATPWRVD